MSDPYYSLSLDFWGPGMRDAKLPPPVVRPQDVDIELKIMKPRDVAQRRQRINSRVIGDRRCRN